MIFLAPIYFRAMRSDGQKSAGWALNFPLPDRNPLAGPERGGLRTEIEPDVTPESRIIRNRVSAVRYSGAATI